MKKILTTGALLFGLSIAPPMLAQSAANCLKFDDAVEIINKGYYGNEHRNSLKQTCRADVPYAMVVAIKKDQDFYKYFAAAISKHYPDLHMLALSIKPAVIQYIPKDDMSPDLALKAVANWDSAYKHMAENLRRNKEIIFRTLQHGKERLDTVMDYHPDSNEDGFNYQAALTNKQNCEVGLILFAGSQDKTSDALDELRAVAASVRGGVGPLVGSLAGATEEQVLDGRGHVTASVRGGVVVRRVGVVSVAGDVHFVGRRDLRCRGVLDGERGLARSLVAGLVFNAFANDQHPGGEAVVDGAKVGQVGVNRVCGPPVERLVHIVLASQCLQFY